jgi:hypothetical protein
VRDAVALFETLGEKNGHKIVQRRAAEGDRAALI